MVATDLSSAYGSMSTQCAREAVRINCPQMLGILCMQWERVSTTAWLQTSSGWIEWNVERGRSLSLVETKKKTENGQDDRDTKGNWVNCRCVHTQVIRSCLVQHVWWTFSWTFWKNDLNNTAGSWSWRNPMCGSPAWTYRRRPRKSKRTKRDCLSACQDQGWNQGFGVGCGWRVQRFHWGAEGRLRDICEELQRKLIFKITNTHGIARCGCC